MKILIFIDSLGAGGAEKSMVEFAKFLHNREDTCVKFICIRHIDIGFEEEVKDFGIEIIFFNGKSSFRNKLSFLIDEIKKERPDIIHSILYEANLLLRVSRFFGQQGAVIQSLVNTPYSLERKKDNKLPWHKFQLAKQLEKWSARFTPKIYYHAITKTVLEHYRPMFKFKNNSRIIYRGRYQNVNHKDVKKKTSGLSLINTGRQEFAKGQIDILKALTILRSKYNIQDVHLEILGRTGKYSDNLLEYVEEHNLQDQVEIHGFVNNVEERLVKADVFVFPSYYEGLGGALLEAFAAKLPCVCSNIPVLKEVVGSEAGALFSIPGDYEQLALNIKLLYDNPDKREKLSNYSYARFQKHFKMESINEQMLNMYKDVISQNS
jgi:glycosyltransferase involved in cell wall biosynthesis